jgi:hypothetical protein
LIGRFWFICICMAVEEWMEVTFVVCGSWLAADGHDMRWDLVFSRSREVILLGMGA